MIRANELGPHVWRANIILLTADGLGTNAIMRGNWARQIRRVALAGVVHARASAGSCATKPARPAASRSTRRRSSSTLWPDRGRSARRNHPLDQPEPPRRAAVRDANCNRMTPSHAVKNARRYRYYV